jgi:hypothetical protein
MSLSHVKAVESALGVKIRPELLAPVLDKIASDFGCMDNTAVPQCPCKFDVPETP